MALLLVTIPLVPGPAAGEYGWAMWSSDGLKLRSQGSAAPGYTAPRAYYPAPARSYAPPPPASYSYAPPAPRVGQYGDFDGYRAPPPGYAANGGYYPQDARSNGGYYAPPYGAPNADYASPNQH